MTRPENLFEQASYDLNKFRERRIADRRSVARDTIDRRASRNDGVNGEGDRGQMPADERDGDN